MGGWFFWEMMVMDFRDLGERVLATFVQASLGALGTNGVFDLGVDSWKLVLMAGVSAGLAVLKGAAAARLVGVRGSSSLVG